MQLILTTSTFVASLLVSKTHGFAGPAGHHQVARAASASVISPSFLVPASVSSNVLSPSQSRSRSTTWLGAAATDDEEAEEVEDEIADETEASVADDDDEESPADKVEEEEAEVAVEEKVADEPAVIIVAKEEEETSPAATGTTDASTMQAIFALGSITGRGEFATSQQHDTAMELITSLEASGNPNPNPTFSTTTIQGRWELVYSNTQLFRSSPFFMAGRAVCQTPEQAQQYDWFCDMHRGALAMSQIGAVRQIISSNRLISEFEVKAGTVPFLNDFTPFSYSGGWPVTIEGAIVSSADITPTGNAWEIYMDTVEIKGSNLPGLRQVLDNGLALKSRELAQVLEDNIASYQTPRPLFTTTYLTDTMRISKDDDGKVFVYTKTSDDTAPTDYSGRMADLGVGKLLEGFNDAITKFYI